MKEMKEENCPSVLDKKPDKPTEEDKGLFLDFNKTGIWITNTFVSAVANKLYKCRF